MDLPGSIRYLSVQKKTSMSRSGSGPRTATSAGGPGTVRGRGGALKALDGA